MAEVDRNTPNKDAFLLVPKVREQTQKQMQPHGGLNKELPSKAFRFCMVPSLAYQQAASSGVEQPQKGTSQYV